MHKNIFFTLVLSLFISLVFNQNVIAQEDSPSSAIIGQYTRQNTDPESLNGFGITYSKHFVRFFGMDTAFNFFPKDGAKTLQLTAGPKVGYRTEKFGIFGKFRPGTQIFYLRRPGAVADDDTEASLKFAMDFGGIVEVYPSRRLGLRFEAGNMMTKLKITTSNPGSPLVEDSKFVSNFQLSTGIMLRF